MTILTLTPILPNNSWGDFTSSSVEETIWTQFSRQMAMVRIGFAMAERPRQSQSTIALCRPSVERQEPCEHHIVWGWFPPHFSPGVDHQMGQGFLGVKWVF
jgi:hypothetical protein